MLFANLISKFILLKVFLVVFTVVYIEQFWQKNTINVLNIVPKYFQSHNTVYKSENIFRNFSNHPPTVTNTTNTSSLLHPIEVKIKTMFDSLPRQPIQSEFLQTLLIIIYNYPHYESIPFLRNVYENIFAKIVTCGSPSKDKNKPDVEMAIDRGWFGYICTSRVMEVYSSFEGYMVVSDDMVVNWWLFHKLPKDKVWIDHPDYKTKLDKPPNQWYWWKLPVGFAACRDFFNDFKNTSFNDKNINLSFVKYMASCNSIPCCGASRSDAYYVPKKHAATFIALSQKAFYHKLFLEIAVPLILGSCDEVENHVMLNGYFIQTNQKGLSKQDLLFWRSYNLTYHMVHPLKFSRDKENQGKNFQLFNKYFLKYSKDIQVH